MSLTKTYEVFDVVFKDIGTDTNYAAWTNDINLTLVRGTDYTTLSQTDTSSAGIHRLNPSITYDLCIECDLYIDVGSSYTGFIQFRQSTSNKGSISITNFNTGEWQHLKLTVDGTTVSINVDGVDKNPLTLSSSTWDRVYFQILYNTTVKYKNFIIYPI